MLSQPFSNTTPHCLDVSFLLNNKPLLEKAGLVWFISDYCRLLDSSLLTSAPQSLRRLRISVSDALLAGGETLDAPLSMTAALCRAAGERLGSRQQNRSARCAAFRGSASSRGEQPMSSAHCLERINSQNFSRLALHLHSHCCEPKIITVIFSTIFLAGSGNPSGRCWVWLLETERAHPSCLILEGLFTQRTELLVYRVMCHPRDSRRTLLPL